MFERGGGGVSASSKSIHFSPFPVLLQLLPSKAWE